MVFNQALQRTFFIQYRNQSGTCFVLDVDERQYIITAKHIFPDAVKNSDAIIQVSHDGGWFPFPCKIVGVADDDVDIIVLAAPSLLSTVGNLLLTRDNLILGQTVYFLGYPFGLTGSGTVNQDFPLPVVKSACLAMFPNPKVGKFMLLDGLNNPGFSGGPVVYSQLLAPITEGTSFVAGVISGYRGEQSNIYVDDQKTPNYVLINTGLILCYPIEYAIDLIKLNPIGPSTD